MKLTAETVTKDNIIEYLEGKDINIIGVDEYKDEIVFDDFTGSFEFSKNYENLINKNKEEDREEKKRKSFIDVILSSSILPFIVIGIIWLLLLCVHLLFDTDPNIFIVLFVIGPFIHGILEIMIMD